MTHNRPADHDHNRLLREKRLFQYTRALERGDLATVAAILKLATTDRLLDEMIAEVNAVYAQEAETAALAARTTAPAAHTNHHQPNLKAKGVDSMIAIATPRKTTALNIPYTLLAVAAALTLFVGVFTLLNRGGGAYLSPGGGDNGQSGILQTDPTPPPSGEDARGRCAVTLDAATDITLAAEAGGTAEIRLTLPAGFTVTREREQVTLDAVVWSLVLVQAPGLNLYGWTDDPAFTGECITRVDILPPTVVPPLMTATPVGSMGDTAGTPPTATPILMPGAEAAAEASAGCIRTLPAGTVLELFIEPGLTLSLPLTLETDAPALFSLTRTDARDVTWVMTMLRTRTATTAGWVQVASLPVDLDEADACETDVEWLLGSVDGAPVPLVTHVPTMLPPTVSPPINVTATPLP